MSKKQFSPSARHLLLGALLGVLAFKLFIRINNLFQVNRITNTTTTMVTKQQAIDVNDRVVLPTNVKQLHYDLQLKPDMEKFVFDGKVTVKYNTPILIVGFNFWKSPTLSV